MRCESCLPVVKIAFLLFLTSEIVAENVTLDATAARSTATPLTSRCNVGDARSLCGIVLNNRYIGDVKVVCDWEDFCRTCHCVSGRWMRKDCSKEECKLDDFRTLGKFGNSTYMLGQKLMTWPIGKSTCVAAGGELASIETDEEFEAIKSLFSPLPYKLNEMSWWIGGYSRGRDGYPMDHKTPILYTGDEVDKTPWYWLSGSEISWYNPRFSSGNWHWNTFPKCLNLWPWSTNGNIDMWHPKRCLAENFPLCEIRSAS